MTALGTALDRPFLIPGTEPLGPAELRRRNLTRTVSWGLVAALHVAFFFAFVIAFTPWKDRARPIVETILMLAPPGNRAPDLHVVNPELVDKSPPQILSAPITIRPPPPVVMPEIDGAGPTPGDILGAVGRTLACAPGSWEHLTGPERMACGGSPWRGMRLPNGSLVMVPPSQLPRLREAPVTEFTLNSGRDLAQRQLQIGQDPSMGGCPILQNTPCLHLAPNMREMTGQ